jgi:hypothetical protein
MELNTNKKYARYINFLFHLKVLGGRFEMKKNIQMNQSIRMICQNNPTDKFIFIEANRLMKQ